MSVYAEIFWEHLQVVGDLLASTERVLGTFGENSQSYWRPCGKFSHTSGDMYFGICSNKNRDLLVHISPLVFG